MSGSGNSDEITATKILIYIPVIHTSADLGSLADEVAKRGITNIGKDRWEEHQNTVDGFWKAISTHLDSLNVSGMKLYQDGMIADGDVGQAIVGEGVKLGSKNYEIVYRLLQRGAILVKTEDYPLVKEERDRLLAITQAHSRFQRIRTYLRYKLTQNRLLNRRDKFIAQRIRETLRENETGILLIGAYHQIIKRLPAYIKIRTLKDPPKIKEYQQLLPFSRKPNEHFEELSRYLVSKVAGEVK